MANHNHISTTSAIADPATQIEAIRATEANRAPPSFHTAGTIEEQTAAFNADPNTYYDRETGTWRYENEDGTEMEWDITKNSWKPVVDEELVKNQQAAYSIAGVDEATPAAPVLARENKKRKQREDSLGPAAGPSIKRGKGKGKDKNGGERRSKNTAVYVTGLPLDTDFDEMVERFSKCGLIEEDDKGEPKVKMYARDDGTFSGEALVVYFKEDSVTLALNILDDAELRLGDGSTRMSVRKAEFSHKGGGGDGGGTQNVVERKTVDRKKATKRLTRMQRKLEEWDDEDAFGPALDDRDRDRDTNKNGRVVVLKHMFTLKELEEDATLLLDLKEDVRDECSSLGEVTNVVLYDNEPDGVMTIKYRDPLSAQACVLRMNGRFFAGRKIEASLYSGRQRFKRGGAGEDYGEGGEDAEKARLAEFESWLMAEGE
ncbi:hypothetical protein JAAARDRAFT_35306 [Jaapia argillacea MUCL 33604]|uniref:RRM domain-containing protein n=1 Tax=Jaapia argillacea MUCL 33604 TaxID=933084 RepID=A0A067PS18_9AGAM|nr:hypothetical protein JAAARDRAFT_35306 [Jaapia argillacea MUCL 33604]